LREVTTIGKRALIEAKDEFSDMRKLKKRQLARRILKEIALEEGCDGAKQLVGGD
jgi:hypothetical protein